jgi:hypothetical protein
MRFLGRESNHQVIVGKAKTHLITTLAIEIFSIENGGGSPWQVAPEVPDGKP